MKSATPQIQTILAITNQTTGQYTEPMLLRGHIQTFYVKHNGRRLGPYYARVWKQNGRRRRQYVPAHRLEQVIAACQGYRERRRRQIEQSKELTRILGNLSFLTRACRRAKRIDHLLPHEQEHVRRIQTQGIAAPGRPSVWRRRGFMGHLRKLWVQKALERARQKPDAPAPVHLPFTTYHLPTEPSQPEPKTSKRYWRLPHELPEWFTDELWEEMAKKIPQG